MTNVADLGPALPGLRCLRKLGSGGFSDVYLYERHQPRVKVAVKFLRPDLPAQSRHAFSDEADIMAELAEHPFIVPVLGAGTAPDGRPYLEMRYFGASDLGARVARQPLDVAEALKTGIQVASAVETAHRSGIVHRDIKPSNILVDPYGRPGLSDFGIAGRGARKQPHDLGFGVSVPWSPPEVLSGSSEATVSSDVYSLSATIWNLLTGRPPYDVPGGDNGEQATLARILRSSPPKTGRADVPHSLDRALQRAMAKDPLRRPQSALQFAQSLQRVEQELGLTRTDIVVLDINRASQDERLNEAGQQQHPLSDSGVTVMRPRKTPILPAAGQPAAASNAPMPASSDLHGTVHRPRSTPKASTGTPVSSGGRTPGRATRRWTAAAWFAAAVGVLIVGGATAALIQDSGTAEKAAAPTVQQTQLPTSPKIWLKGVTASEAWFEWEEEE